jgi:hypothetical protein
MAAAGAQTNQSGPLQPLDNDGHQAQGTQQNDQEGDGHRRSEIAIIITK